MSSTLAFLRFHQKPLTKAKNPVILFYSETNQTKNKECDIVKRKLLAVFLSAATLAIGIAAFFIIKKRKK